MSSLVRQSGSWLFLGLFISLLSAQDAPKKEEGDLVKLKNGQEIVGRITAEDETTVTILFRGGELVLPRRRITDIIRGERRAVEAIAAKNDAPPLARFEKRTEHFFVFYRGRCVGWRETSVDVAKAKESWGYGFRTRTVYLDQAGKVEVDTMSSQIVDAELTPVSAQFSTSGAEQSSNYDANIEKGFARIRYTQPNAMSESEILFKPGTDLMLPLMRKLADSMHFPEKGEAYRVFDLDTQEFKKIHAQRTLKKEIVAGKHQFVTVWKLTSGEKSWEIWVDGWGGIVREELGSGGVVALRASSEKVLAFARGEGKPDTSDLVLAYESEPSRFRIERPNLTWSFDFPEEEEKRVMTIANPVQQASVDVMVLDHIGQELESETVLLDLFKRMERTGQNQKVLYQKVEKVGGQDGIRFESTADLSGVGIKTVGAVTVANGKGYAVLCAAPLARFGEVSPSFEKILKSFEITGAKVEQVD